MDQARSEVWEDIMTQEHANGDETDQQNAAPGQNESRATDAPDEHPADTDPPQSRASLSVSRRGTLALLVGVSGLSLLSEPASAVPGSFQSPTGTGAAVNEPFSSPITLSNPGPDGGSFFGRGVAMSADGTTALIGASREDIGACEEAGEAYVFTRTAAGWDTDNPVTIPNPEPASEHDHFGYSVAVSADGTTALVSAPADDPAGEAIGTVYVFTQTAAGWNTDNPVVIPNPEPVLTRGFGDAVALSADGTTALIGVPYVTDARSFPGEAYLFSRTAEGWTTDSPVTLRNPDPDPTAERFGKGVALSADGTTALIGAPQATGTYSLQKPGEAYLFSQTAEGWNTDTPVTIPNPADKVFRDEFGWSVALDSDGTTALVGAPSRGTAHLFSRTAEGWDTESPVAFSNRTRKGGDGRFGYSVALSADGTTALVGAPSDDTDAGDSAGTVSLFRQTAEGWDIDNPVTLPNPEPDNNDRFGEAVAMNPDGTTLLVGASGESHNTGAAYLYEQETQSLISADHALSGDTLTEQRGGIREWIRRYRRRTK